MTTYLVLGAGMQGTACVYDLIRHGGARAVTWIDADSDRLEQGLRRIRRLTSFDSLRGQAVDASDRRALQPLFTEAEVCVNALPYRFAPAMTVLSLEGRTHYLDLGGNTEIVREQLELHRAHPRAAELCVLPDCGLMPGMGNLFVAHAVNELGDLSTCEVRCGGLPREPKPPLGYKLVFSVAGLTNEYFGKAHVLRDGKLTLIPTFEELEQLDIEGVGECEAFLTSGGLGTTPWTFEGRIDRLDYKTVRYRGHHAKFQTLLELGLLGEEPVRVGRTTVVPRQLLHVLLEERLAFPDDTDLVFLRMTAVAKQDGESLVMEVLDLPDPEDGFSAMERTTAYSATAIAALVAKGEVPPGPNPIETAVDPEKFLAGLAERGIDVCIDRTSPTST